MDPTTGVDPEDLRYHGDPVDVFVALAELLEGRPAWHADALCKEPTYRRLSWFPGRGDDVTAAKRVCDRCIVRVECQDAAIDSGERHGIWGGLSQRERRTVRLRRRRIDTSGAA